ncbi:MAG: glycerol-3-phosphate 1-O-acyltransferase PlsY [Clostridia bacterium]
MALNGRKKVYIRLSILAAITIVFALTTFLWNPFAVEKQSIYSSGIISLYVTQNITTMAVWVQTLLWILMIILCSVLPYFLGSTNFAILISRLCHNDDIRKYGSKNAGMTNMIRVYGKKDGILTLVGDALKCSAAVFFGRFIGGESGAYLAALFCILGHIAPAQYKFKGGKGVVAAAVAMLCLDPISFLISLVVFIAAVAISRFVSMGSIFGAFVYPASVFYLAKFRGNTPQIIPMIFAIFVGLLVIFMHRENIKRIYEGKENKITFKKQKKDETKK